jgi:hypothetical protein
MVRQSIQRELHFVKTELSLGNFDLITANLFDHDVER